MKYVQEIAALISIRNFMAGSIDNMQIKLSREEVRAIQTRVSTLDKAIVDASLKLDLTEFGKERQVVKQLSFTSVDEPEDVYSRVKASESVQTKSPKNVQTKEESEKLFDDTDGK